MSPSRNPLGSVTPEQRKLLESLAAQGYVVVRRTGIRKRSAYEFLGMPLYAIAVGPDASRKEMRGHAKGVVAVGDIATGVFAFGGWARGVFAFGGLATGLVTIGGLSIGIVSAFGGLALSALLAVGGGAAAPVAIGGAALGRYAVGGAPAGQYVVGPRRVDAEALELFSRFGIPASTKLE